MHAHDVVVLAAHRRGLARVATPNSNNREGRAVQPNLRRHILQDDPKQGQDRRPCSGVRLPFTSQYQNEERTLGLGTHALNTVAALDGARVAVTSGGRKGGKGEGGDRSDTGEHGVW